MAGSRLSSCLCCISNSATEDDSEKNADQKTGHKPSIVPKPGEYAVAGTKQAIASIQSALAIAGGIPGAHGALELALALIQMCEDISEVERRAANLKNRIEYITHILIQGLQGRSHSDIPEDMLRDIEKLQADLGKIKGDLDEISSQSRILTVLFRNINKTKIDACMDVLKDSLVHWQITRDISTGVVLHNVEQGVGRLQSQVDTIEQSLGVMIKQVQTVKHASSRQLPPRPSIFYGQDAFVQEVVQILTAPSSPTTPSPRVCIHGPGGIGKTSTALAIMHHPDIIKKFADKSRHWIPCVGATSPDLLLQILYSNLAITVDTGDRLADIVAELTSSEIHKLVLLDNFETPWYPADGATSDVKEILNTLSAIPHLSILITMRTNIPPSDDIDWINLSLNVIDPTSAAEIYTTIHPAAKGKPKLNELLKELGYMPFAIVLLASQGKETKTMPEGLLEQWQQLGPDMLPSLADSEVGENAMSRSISLSLNSRLMQKNPAAQTLLATLCLLPAGTAHSHLDWWAPAIRKIGAAISVLNKVALVTDEEVIGSGESLISSIPVVQSFMRHAKLIPPTVVTGVREACFQYVLNHQSTPNDINFRSDLSALSKEEANIHAILLEVIRTVQASTPLTVSETTFQVLIAFSYYQSWTKPRTDLIQQTLALARLADNERYVAEALSCLGAILFSLDKYPDALVHYKEARGRFRTLSDKRRICDCSHHIADLCLYMGNDPAECEEAIQDILDGQPDSLADNYNKAYWHLASAEKHWVYMEKIKSLEHSNAALQLFETMQGNWSSDIALCLSRMAMTFGNLNRFSEALDAINKSLVLGENYGTYRDLLLALLRKAILLESVCQDTDEMVQTVHRARLVAKTLGGPLLLAQALELSGGLCARKLDLPNAREHYQAAEACYASIGNARIAADCLKRCQTNLCCLTEMQSMTKPVWNGIPLCTAFG